MRLIKISGVFALLILMSVSCKTKKDSSKGDTSKADGQEQVVTDIQMTESLLLPKPIDPVTINSISITGDVLEIDVSYGGCKLHDFVLYGNHSYQKSLPPKLGLALIHSAHGDKCKKITTKKMYYNIKDIRYPGKDKDYVLIVYVNQNVGKSADYKY